MKKVPLGVPLALGLFGTLATLVVKNKSLHVVFGIILAITCSLHMFQHNKKLKKDVQKGFRKMNILKAVGIPTSRLDLFLKTIKVKSYIPGRIRIYSRALINNSRNKASVEAELAKYKELTKYEVNSITGSLLIEYDPEQIKNNPLLLQIENFAKNSVKK